MTATMNTYRVTFKANDVFQAHIAHAPSAEAVAAWYAANKPKYEIIDVVETCETPKPGQPVIEIEDQPEPEAPEKTEETRNMDHVTYIAKTLEQVADGVLYTCPECDEWIEPTFEENTDGNTLTCPNCGHVTGESDMDPVTMFDYFSDVYNIEYRIDGRKDYQSIELMVAYGGPNVYVDTGTKTVELYWGGDHAPPHTCPIMWPLRSTNLAKSFTTVNHTNTTQSGGYETMNNKILALLAEIETVCNAWNETKEAHAHRGGWMFSYKLYDLAYACEDDDVFCMAAEVIREDWDEMAREAAGYIPETWDYSKYFEHDQHNGSYFNFREDVESAWSLDFWANNVGLEWDVTTGKEWGFTPFEKAVYDTYGTTRFSTDRLAPEDYDEDELADIADTLEKHTLPALRETLAERLAIIEAYEAIKADQVNYLEYAKEALAI